MLGMGRVTAVDQAGGTFCAGVGTRFEAGVSGRVVAAEMFGRGVINVEIGLSGRGGRLIRSVSRLGGCGSVPSDPGGLADSAIKLIFIVISENVQWRSW
jgi:hypothetical protein